MTKYNVLLHALLVLSGDALLTVLLSLLVFSYSQQVLFTCSEKLCLNLFGSDGSQNVEKVNSSPEQLLELNLKMSEVS